MSHWKSLAVICANWIVLVSGYPEFAEAQQAVETSVAVGGRAIVFPTPHGFVRSDGISAEWDSAVTAMLPATNRLLVAFSTYEEVEGIRKQQPSGTARNFNCQIVRNVESQEIGERTFAQVRSGARAELEKMKSQLDDQVKRVVQEGNQRLSDQFGVDVALTISDSAMLGFFEETPTSLGFTMAMNVGSGNEAGAKPDRWVVAAIMVPVNGRLINLYANSPYGDDEDRIWAEQAVAAWRDAVVNANPRIAGPAGGGFDPTAAFRSGVIGGVIGGLVGGFMWLFKKNRTKDRAA